nr:hypothetical protein [uncultured Agathobaculum sp.]
MAAIATRDSAAYKRYNEKLPAVNSEKKSDLHLAKPPKKRRRRSLRRNVILSVLAAAGVCTYILYCQMQLTQLTAEVSKQSDTLTEMQAENVSLTTKKMNSMDMDEVEQHAVDDLGMVKMDNSQIEYVELTRPDVVTVSGSGHSLGSAISGLTEWFSSVVEYIR